MKKIISIILLIMLVFTPIASFADELEDEKIEVWEIWNEVIQTVAKATKEPSLNSRAAIVFDRDSKTVLYDKNMNEKRAMASTTKIMTAIVALESSKLEQEITVSKKAASVGGSSLELRTGDKITMNDLLYGLMLVSRK